MRSLVCSMLAIVALTSCGDDSEGDAADCLSVDAQTLAAIAGGDSGLPMTPISGAAVQSGDSSYLIAMSFDAPGGDSVVGVWGSTRLVGGPIVALDGAAQEFTQWPPSSADRSEIQAAKGCLD